MQQPALLRAGARARCRAIPGVESAALATRVPLQLNANRWEIWVPGRHRPGEHGDTVEVTTVSPDYFKTMGVGDRGRTRVHRRRSARHAAGRDRQRDAGAAGLARPERDRQDLPHARRRGAAVRDRRRLGGSQGEDAQRAADAVPADPAQPAAGPVRGDHRPHARRRGARCCATCGANCSRSIPTSSSSRTRRWRCRWMRRCSRCARAPGWSAASAWWRCCWRRSACTA